MTPGEVLTVNGKEYRCTPKGTEYDYEGEAGVRYLRFLSDHRLGLVRGRGGPRYDGV